MWALHRIRAPSGQRMNRSRWRDTTAVVLSLTVRRPLGLVSKRGDREKKSHCAYAHRCGGGRCLLYGPAAYPQPPIPCNFHPHPRAGGHTGPRGHGDPEPDPHASAHGRAYRKADAHHGAARPLFTYMYALRLLRAAQYEDAIPQFSIVVRILPDFALAYHGRGLAYFHEEQEELAQEDFSKAIELKPDYADAYRNRGVIYMNAGEVLKGVADLQKALELFEDAGNTRAVEEVKAFLSPAGQ